VWKVGFNLEEASIRLE